MARVGRDDSRDNGLRKSFRCALIASIFAATAAARWAWRLSAPAQRYEHLAGGNVLNAASI